MTLVTQHLDSLSTDIMRLSHTTQEVNSWLQAQAKLLQIRQLSLPAPVLGQMTAIHDTMQQLAAMVDQENNELAQLRALSNTAQIMNSSMEWESVITRAMETIIKLTDAERGYILLHNDKTDDWDVIVAQNIDQSIIQQQDFAVSRTIIDEVIKTGKAVTTNNAREDSRFKFEDSILRYDMRSIMCVPLVYQDEISGVIYVDNPFQHGSFGDNELRVMSAFANQAAIAIKNAQLFNQVREQISEVNEIRQFLDSVFDSIASGVISTNADGNIRTFNPAAAGILGVVAAECIGQPLLDVLPPIYEGFDQVLQQVLEQGRIEVIEINTVLPERGPSHLSLKLSPLRDEADSTLGIALVVDDLTDIKRRDETLNVIRTYLSPAMVSQIESIDSLGLGGEERYISAIFADVRGFTTFSEYLEPEILMQFINQYLSLGADAINRHEGIIDKYMGDAIVGLFNTQLNTHDDHAKRAVLTALAIVEQVTVLQANLPPDQRLAYGIGVHTDWAMLGNVGSPSRKEFTALGNAITYSKKLQEIAQPHEIIISKTTYDLVRDMVEVDVVERATRSGDTLMNAYRLVGLR